MSWNWYELFDKAEFEAEGLVSRTLTVTLEGEGEKEILITKGEAIGLVIDEIFLSLHLEENNPYTRDGYGIFEAEDGMVWVGVEEE